MIALLAGGVAIRHTSIHAQQIDHPQVTQSTSNIEQQSKDVHQKLLLNSDTSFMPSKSDVKSPKSMAASSQTNDPAQTKTISISNNNSSNSDTSQSPYVKANGKWGTANVNYWSNDTMEIKGNGIIDVQTPQLPFNNYKNDWKLKINDEKANVDFKFNNVTFGGPYSIWKHFISMDLSGLNTDKMISMSDMFAEDYNLKFLNLSGKFKTSNVIDMNSMFHGDTKLTNLNLNSFNTSKVTNMNGMFFNTGLKSLDLSNFNTNNVISMSEMFGLNDNLRSLNINSFDTNKVSDMSNMFMDDFNLNELDLGKETHLNHNQTWDARDSFKDSNNNDATHEIINGSQPAGKYYIVRNSPIPKPVPHPQHSLTSSESSYANQISSYGNAINNITYTSQTRSAQTFADNVGGDTESLINSYNKTIDEHNPIEVFSDVINPNNPYIARMINPSSVSSISNDVNIVSSAISGKVSVASSASASLSASTTNSYENMAQSIADNVNNSTNASYASEIAQLNNSSSNTSNNVNSYEFSSLENKVNSLESRPTNNSITSSNSTDKKVNSLEKDVETLKSELNHKHKKHSSKKSNNKIYISKLSKWRRNKINRIKYLRHLNNNKIRKSKHYLKHRKPSKSNRRYLNRLIKINKTYNKKIHDLHYRINKGSYIKKHFRKANYHKFKARRF